MDNESLNLIYTVLVSSHAVNVCDILELQVCRLAGAAVFQNATCTHPIHASVAQVVFRITHVELVYKIASLDHVVYAV